MLQPHADVVAVCYRISTPMSWPNSAACIAVGKGPLSKDRCQRAAGVDVPVRIRCIGCALALLFFPYAEARM